MDTLMLSMVIPVYNLEQYIGRCLDSCLDQDVDRACYEIVCVDDGSSDGTADILDRYSAEYANIHVVHTVNQGVVKARNTGLSLAKGRFIWFVDGDDWIQKNSLRYMMDAVEDNDADMLLFKERRVTEYCVEENPEFLPPRVIDGGYVTYDDRYATGSGFHWFSKRIMDEQQLSFRPDVYYSDDTLFMAKFRPYVRRTVVLDTPIYYYLQRADSVSHAVKSSLHCACMYKLAQEYRQLSLRTYPNYSGKDIVAKMRNGQLRSMQSCVRDFCFYCRDRKFLKEFLRRAKQEGLYPFGVDWKQFRIDRRQSRKADLMNWLFGFCGCKPYLWFCWYLCAPLRKKHGKDTFDWKDFENETV